MMSRRERERYVETRAVGRCEYYRMHQSLQGVTFHVEHIVLLSRGGQSQLDNLAWACPSCNLHTANRVETLDPDTGNQVPLFHPRSNHWEMYFRWEGYELVGQTSIGRATIAALRLNHLRRIQIRQVEELFALFPPRDLSA